jgi:hypothetical protein
LIEAHDHALIDHDNGSGHVPEYPQFIQSTRFPGDVLLGECNLLLRKILFRFPAKQSTRLRIDHHTLHPAPRINRTMFPRECLRFVLQFCLIALLLDDLDDLLGLDLSVIIGDGC